MRRLDLTVALSIFFLSALTGFVYCRLYTGVPQYYQRWFGPAVMFASGHGFANPSIAAAPHIKEFLDGKRKRLGPEDVPAETPHIPLQVEQRVHRYLLLCVGLWWRLAGIAWSQVAVVSALLYGLATVSVYAMFRLAVRRTFAVLGALWLCFSATQLENVVHLRDYSKAPFILAALAITAWVALRSLSRRSLLALSVLCGVILGIGTGFRPDVAVAGVPVFVVALMLFHAGRPWHDIRGKLVALGAFLLGFGAFATPILVNLSNNSHVTILGLMEPHDDALGIARSIYSFGHYYNDTYVQSVVGSYAERVHDVHFDTPAFALSTDLDRMGTKYLFTVGRQFPADMWARGLAAVAAILELPFGPVFAYHLPPGIPLQGIATAVYGLPRLFSGLGVPLAVALLMGMAIRRAKDALFAAFVLLFMLGLSAMQFNVRHYFHLQFVSLLGLLLLLDVLFRFAADIARHRRRRDAMPFRSTLAAAFRRAATSSATVRAARAAWRAGLIALLIVATTILPLGLLRRYQQSDVKRLFGAYVSAERQEIHLIVRTDHRGRELMTWDGAAGRAFGSGRYLTDYYVVDVTSDAELAIGAITLTYAAVPPPPTSPPYDLSRTMELAFDKGTNRIFFPVYSSDGFRAFTGLHMGTGMRDRLKGIFRVRDLTRMPLLLDLHLGPEWQRERLFQTVRSWEARGSPRPAVYAALPPAFVSGYGWLDLSPSTAGFGEPLTVRWSDPFMVRADDRSLRVSGIAVGRFRYLVQFRKREISAGASLVARGRLERGGLSVGLIEGDVWYKQVAIDQPGDFAAVLVVDKTGTFVPTIANAIPNTQDRRNRFVITDIGILDSNAVR